MVRTGKRVDPLGGSVQPAPSSLVRDPVDGSVDLLNGSLDTVLASDLPTYPPWRWISRHVAASFLCFESSNLTEAQAT